MLYLVATPIGNLGDISARALETLAAVDFIAAEDTRVTLKLLSHFGIKKPLVSYYEHNKSGSGAMILERLKNGETAALVTDAGMPAISDPGEDMVALCVEAGIDVLIIPGACAAVSALAMSGLPTGRFTFEGFLSTSTKSSREHLDELKTERRTMIFYEAPHKLKRTLEDMLEAFGDRRISLSREMTKIHEETLRTTFSGALEFYAEKPPRGEYVLVIEGVQSVAAEQPSMDDALTLVRELMAEGKTQRDAVKLAAAQTGMSKNALYSAVVAEKTSG